VPRLPSSGAAGRVAGAVRRLAVLSMHTSPLAQPGSGDGGGMNVYVRQLAAALARSGVLVDVYTRADDPALPAVVGVEPGLRVHHIAAGPLAPVPKRGLAELVEEFTEGVATRFRSHPPDALHANYWLSGVAGHVLKHRFDLPLGCTFHTLARVKGLEPADARDRVAAEVAVVGCCDAIVTSCGAESEEVVDLYGADPERVVVIAPGVDHALFGPGSRAAARRAIGAAAESPILLSVGRIQPLKGLDVAVDAFGLLPASVRDRATLVVVGGPSGPDGAEYLDGVRRRARALDVQDRIRWVAPQPHEMLASYYRAADVALVPSQSESFGLVALEAAACGTPVVATAVGGLRTLVVNGRTGLLRPRTPDAFAEAAATILGDAVYADGLGRAAAGHARQFTWSGTARQFISLFSDLADRAPVLCS
jgi:D-inositol-3-phosphate glycosyltransferase